MPRRIAETQQAIDDALLAEDFREPGIRELPAAVLGWVGLTVLGTLVTLWPTMLRTRLAGWQRGFDARARPAATFSSSSPIVNRNTTTAASGVAPMRIAPTVAIDISVSMLNGEPARAAAIAANWPARAGP